MYYSKDNAVTFIVNGRTYNTWNSWRLIPTSRPSIALPDVRTKYVDIPGMQGKLDISESLTGSVLYENVKGSFEFYYSRFENSSGIVLSWPEELGVIVSALHGKTGVMYIDQNPEVQYSGRFTVKKWTTDKNYSKVSIDYECSPVINTEETPTQEEEEEYSYKSPLWNSVAIPFPASTATLPVSKGQFVYWKTYLYRATSTISVGDTLSTDNLSYVGNGGLNSLYSDIISLISKTEENRNLINLNTDKIETLQSATDAHALSIDSISSRLSTVETRSTQNSEQISDHSTRLSTVETRSTQNSEQISSNSTRIGNLLTRMSAAETNIENVSEVFSNFLSQMGLVYYNGITYVNPDQ